MNEKILILIVMIAILYFKVFKGKIPTLDDIMKKVEDIFTAPPIEAWEQLRQVTTIIPQLKMLSPSYCLLTLNYTDLISMVSSYGANAIRFFAYCNWGDEGNPIKYSAWARNEDLSKLSSVVSFCNSKGMYAVVSIFTQYNDLSGLTPLSAPEKEKVEYVKRVVAALKSDRVIYDLTNEGGGGEWVLAELKKYGVLTCSYGSNIGANYYSVHTGQKSYAGPSGDGAFIHSTDTPTLIHLSDNDIMNIAQGAISAGGNFEFLLAWGRKGREGALTNSTAILNEYGNVLSRIRDL